MFDRHMRMATRYSATIFVVCALASGCTNAPMPMGNGDPPDDDIPPTCEPSCGFGQICEKTGCVPTDQPAVEFGYTDNQTDTYAALGEGDSMPYFTLGQGGSHMFVTIRAAGVTPGPGGTLDITYIMTRQTDGSVLSGFNESTEFSPVEDGILEANRRLVLISEFPNAINGAGAVLLVRVTSPTDPAQSASIEQPLVLEFVP